MTAIGDFVQKAEYDLYLFSELWMRPDHETIRRKIPEGYFMTWYGDLTSSACDGRWTVTSCSGLAIVSRFPFIEKEFLPFGGGPGKTNLEDLVRKGAGESYDSLLSRSWRMISFVQDESVYLPSLASWWTCS